MEAEAKAILQGRFATPAPERGLVTRDREGGVHLLEQPPLPAGDAFLLRPDPIFVRHPVHEAVQRVHGIVRVAYGARPRLTQPDDALGAAAGGAAAGGAGAD